jgi:hypothetical protein
MRRCTSKKKKQADYLTAYKYATRDDKQNLCFLVINELSAIIIEIRGRRNVSKSGDALTCSIVYGRS